MSAPIVFVHRGDDEYLRYSLRQAAASNPDSEIYLIGREANRKYGSGRVKHELIDDYDDYATEFAKLYRHQGPNDREYNLFCFQRWFVLQAFMQAKRLQRCWYLDSDVMVYSSLDNPEYDRFAFEFSWTTPVGIGALDQFCTLVQNQYRDLERFRDLEAYARQIGQPALSDMVLCSLFVRQTRGDRRCYGIFGDSFFDENLNHPLDFPPHYYRIERLDGKKKVYLIQGDLYCKELSAGNYLKANSLHFQAGSKAFMSDFMKAGLPEKDDILYFDYGSREWLVAAP